MTKWVSVYTGCRNGQGFEQTYSDLFAGWQLANEIAKPQVSINSNNSLVDCNKPETEICDRKQKVTSTQVVKKLLD